MTMLKPDHPPRHFFRFHEHLGYLNRVFGEDWFSRKAESFARFFGTPLYLVSQTLLVVVWIVANVTGWVHFDIYPFILLNLAFSLQAAYAAPLILLAQTRQADRDKAHAEADARHREELAQQAEQRQHEISEQTALIAQMLAQNTALTEQIHVLTADIQRLTQEVHQKIA